jgi:hypothetical protein
MICTKGLSKDCLRATCNLPSPYKALETIVNSSSKLTRSSFRRFGNSRNIEVPPGTRMASFGRGSVTNTVFPTPCLVSPCPWADFYPSLFTPHTSLSKNPCQKRAISLKHRHNLFEGGSYRRRGEADHEQRVYPFIVLPLSFFEVRPEHGSLPSLKLPL